MSQLGKICGHEGQNEEDQPGESQCKKHKLEAIQDFDALLPQHSLVQLVQLCKQAGEVGKAFGVLGGRPKKSDCLDEEEKIIQHQLGGFETSRDHQAVKESQRDEIFGFQANAKFCKVWKEALEVNSKEDN